MIGGEDDSTEATQRERTRVGQGLGWVRKPEMRLARDGKGLAGRTTITKLMGPENGVWEIWKMERALKMKMTLMVGTGRGIEQRDHECRWRWVDWPKIRESRESREFRKTGKTRPNPASVWLIFGC